MPRPDSALIVDDEAHVRAFLRLLLREAGILDCEEASNGAQALEMITHRKPGLLMLDVNLPLVSGLAVLAQVRKSDPDIPVIMVSSESTMKTVQESVRLGAIGYLLKQQPKEKVLRSLFELLDSLDAEEPEPDSEDAVE